MSKHVVVIGGGVAGLETAGRLSMAGLYVTLIEKNSSTGGHLNDWYKLFPDRRNSSEVMEYLDGIILNGRINLLVNTSIEKAGRHKDNFLLTLNDGKEMEADAIVVATGFDLFKS